MSTECTRTIHVHVLISIQAQPITDIATLLDILDLLAYYIQLVGHSIKSQDQTSVHSLYLSRMIDT